MSLLTTTSLATVAAGLLTYIFYRFCGRLFFGLASAASMSDATLPPILRTEADPAELVHVYIPDTPDEDFLEIKGMPSDEELLALLPEAESFLLKEAEYVVEELQDVIDHIASAPPNPEEVRSKLHAILCEYALFFNTSYYEAINHYVETALQRDLDLKFTELELHGLWK